MATGGGPSVEISLTAMEKNVVDLVSLHKQSNPVGEGVGVRKKNNQSSSETQESLEHETSSEFEENTSANISDPKQPTPSKKPRKSRTIKKQAIEDMRLELLNKQNENQAEVLLSLKKMESTIYKTYSITKKMYELKKQKQQQENELREIQIQISKKKLEKLNLQIQQIQS